MPEDFAKKINTEDKIEIKAAVSGLNDLTMQKKAFMSLVASNVLCNYLREQNIRIISENNNISGVLLLKDFDLANIIVENNIKIAVRAFVGNDYPQMCIPRSHFSNDILADIYVGVRLETAIDKAEFIGFIEVDKINRQNGNDKYISIGVDQLKPIDNLKFAINSSGRGEKSHFEFEHQKAEKLFFKYIECRISSADKEFFARHISSCTQCSQKFNYIVEIDNMIKAVGQEFDFEENNEDYTLKLFSGDPELLGEEVKINFKEELKEECNVEQKVLGQRKNKYISKRKMGRVVNAAGKLALLSGVVVGGGQIIAAANAASVSGLVGSAALSMAVPMAKGIAESLSSISGSIGNGSGNENYSEKEEFFVPEDNAENWELSFDEFNIDNNSEDIKLSFDEPEIVNNSESEEVGLLVEDNSEDIKLSFDEPEIVNNSESEEVSLLGEDNSEDIKSAFDKAEILSLNEDTPQVNSLFTEVQHKYVGEESSSSDKEADLETNFDDIAIEYDIDDILSSFDTVEVVDSVDFFDFENVNNEAESSDSGESNSSESVNEFVYGETSSEDVNSEKEETETLLDQIYEEKEVISQNDNISDKNAVVADEEEYNFDEDDEEEQDEVTSRKDILRSLDIKIAAGLTAAGIAATIAVALWINNKPSMNQNLPIGNSQPVNQVSSLPVPSGVANNANNNVLPPVNNAAKQPEKSEPKPRTREPLRSYQRSTSVATNKDLSAVLAEAFTRRTYEVEIRNISWEITADMAQNPIFKNYIMVTGQALKSALARDLAMAKERALHTQMEIKTVMDLNGNILEATVVQSSGSKEVDKICLDTYRTTIQFTKLPKIDVKRDKIKANLIISF